MPSGRLCESLLLSKIPMLIFGSQIVGRALSGGKRSAQAKQSSRSLGTFGVSGFYIYFDGGWGTSPTLLFHMGVLYYMH